MPRFVAALLGTALLGAACGEQDPSVDDDLGSLTSQLYAASAYWPPAADGIAHIPVCFLTPGYATERGWVRSTVESQWGSIPTIRFEGWGDCNTSTPAAAIRIIVQDTASPGPQSHLGPSTANPYMWLNFTFNNWGTICANDSADNWPGIPDREYCIRGIALHEFGHALGFGHENNRLADSACGNAESGYPGTLLT